MTTQTLDSLNWKILGSVEGEEVFIADDPSVELIRVRYPNSLRFGHLLDMIAEKKWVYGHLAEVKLYCGPFDGEMIASFTYPE